MTGECALTSCIVWANYLREVNGLTYELESSCGGRNVTKLEPQNPLISQSPPSSRVVLSRPKLPRLPGFRATETAKPVLCEAAELTGGERARRSWVLQAVSSAEATPARVLSLQNGSGRERKPSARPHPPFISRDDHRGYSSKGIGYYVRRLTRFRHRITCMSRQRSDW